MPHWLAIAGMPHLFVSHRRLAGRKSFPRAVTAWALDSGAFSEISEYGGFRTTPREYIAAIRRYDTEIGMLEWAAPQDWMCEPAMLAKTGKTVAEHQRLTVENFRRLTDLWWSGEGGHWGTEAWREWPDLCPVMPVLQGWTLDDYRRHVDAYYAAGVRLEDWPVVGLGSVCRRQKTAEIDRIVRALSPWLALHGFGCKTGALENVGELLGSADSQAWSLRGRHVRGCTPSHKTEANCRTFALAWRDRVVASVGDRHAGQGELFAGAVA